MNVLISLILLCAALVGFYLLEIANAVLWLLFLIIAYPPALAVTAGGPLPASDIVELYRIGVSQIPFVGTIIKTLFFSDVGNKPPPKPDE